MPDKVLISKLPLPESFEATYLEYSGILPLDIAGDGSMVQVCRSSDDKVRLRRRKCASTRSATSVTMRIRQSGSKNCPRLASLRGMKGMKRHARRG